MALVVAIIRICPVTECDPIGLQAAVRLLVVFFYNTLHFGCVEKNAFTKLLGFFAVPNGAEIENLDVEHALIVLFETEKRTKKTLRNSNTYLDVCQVFPLNSCDTATFIKSDLPDPTKICE